MGYYMIAALISANSYLYGIDRKISHGVVFTESRYKPTARGGIGEKGLFQIRKEYFLGPLSMYDPELNICYGLRNLRDLQRLKPKFGKKYFIAHNTGATGLYRRNRAELHKNKYYLSVITRVVRR